MDDVLGEALRLQVLEGVWHHGRMYERGRCHLGFRIRHRGLEFVLTAADHGRFCKKLKAQEVEDIFMHTYDHLTRVANNQELLPTTALLRPLTGAVNVAVYQQVQSPRRWADAHGFRRILEG